MPEISRFYGIIIRMFFNDHLPPHFHAMYTEHEILIEIKNLKTYAGSLPVRQHKIVLEWAKKAKVKAFLLANFERLNPNLRK